MSLDIDFKNAITSGSTATNFTCQLFKLMLKSDATNLSKLSSAYPEEGLVVFFFKNDCVYTDKHRVEVDYRGLVKKARDYLEKEGLKEDPILGSF